MISGERRVSGVRDEELDVEILPGAVDAQGAGAEEPADPDADPDADPVAEPQDHELGDPEEPR